MSGKGLHDLALKDEQLPAQVYDDLPEFGSFTPPPQPGRYRFKLPMDLTKVFEAFDTTKGQRLRFIFDKDAPLTITQSPQGKLNGDTFYTRLSTFERKRGDVETSDADYLLKGLGEKSKPTTLKGYAEKLMAHRGGEFGAEVTYQWFCNDKKNIWVVDQAGKRTEVENTPGCGKGYYQHDKTRKVEQQIARQEDGTYPLEILCACGAVVRAFANLDNITA